MNSLRLFSLAVLAAALATTIPPSAQAGDVPSVPPGYRLETIAHVDQPRELAIAENGDLYVGTLGATVMLVRDAEGTPATPSTFATLPDASAAGVAIDRDALYVGTHAAIWRIPIAAGGSHPAGAPKKLASVRTLGQGGHSTTSVAVSGDRLFIAVGSSCNACEESDPSRATVEEIAKTGGTLELRAKRIRNAIALAIDPATKDLWAGVAGQDDLAHGHPYEIFDDISLHPSVADYAWPHCYEDRKPVTPADTCANAAVPLAAFPAYETPIGAAFYAPAANARYAFGPAFRGGAFVALHGSWHRPLVAPRVVFIPFVDGKPKTTIDWNDASAQWKPFVQGFQRDDESRIGRPTGIAVGPDGSLFVADDQAGAIYRIRPVKESANVPGARKRS